jgi:hypothetical protein
LGAGDHQRLWHTSRQSHLTCFPILLPKRYSCEGAL